MLFKQMTNPALGAKPIALIQQKISTISYFDQNVNLLVNYALFTN